MSWWIEALWICVVSPAVGILVLWLGIRWAERKERRARRRRRAQEKIIKKYAKTFARLASRGE